MSSTYTNFQGHSSNDTKYSQYGALTNQVVGDLGSSINAILIASVQLLRSSKRSKSQPYQKFLGHWVSRIVPFVLTTAACCPACWLGLKCQRRRTLTPLFP